MKYKLIFLTILVASLQLPAYAYSQKTEQRPENWATVVQKSTNFYQVDGQLFRSEQLTEEDIGLLKQQGVNTIVNLRFFNRDKNDEQLDNQGFTLINQPLLTWAVKPKQLANILATIENQHKQGKKVLVHCYHGSDRTGIVIAMYRIVYQNWTIEQAKQEMRQGGYGFHRIWKNLDSLLTEQKVAEVKQHLASVKKS